MLDPPSCLDTPHGTYSLDVTFFVELLSGQISRRRCWKLKGSPDTSVPQEVSRRVPVETVSKPVRCLGHALPKEHWQPLGAQSCGAAGRGNRTANRVSVSSGKNDLKRLAGSGFRGFNILEDARLLKCA